MNTQNKYYSNYNTLEGGVDDKPSFTPITYEQNQNALGNTSGTTYVMSRSERRARDKELKRTRNYNIDMEAAKNGVVKANIFDLATTVLGKLQSKVPKQEQTQVVPTNVVPQPKKKDNTLLYIVGLVVLLAVIYFITQKK